MPVRNASAGRRVAMKMKAWFGAVVAAGAFLLAGCVVEPEDGESGEIRVDAFAHFWESQKLRADSHVGNRLILDSRDSLGNGTVDTLRLASSSSDQTSGLPEHTFDTVDYSSPRIVYALSPEPLEFSCYYHNGGGQLGSQGSPTSNWIFRHSQMPYSDGYPAVQELVQMWWYREGVPETITVMPCGYLKGKGFYFGYWGYDNFATDPRAPGGTFVIRYRY
jgi:hypothetical protein